MRPEKTTVVDEIKSRIDKSPYLILTEFTGMKVPQFNELRNRLRGVGAEYKVIKNSALKKAVESAGLPDMKDGLAGQLAIVTGDRDISQAAKIIKTFASEFEKPVVKLGVLDRALLTAPQVKAIADLPGKAELQAKLLGVLMAPSSALVRLLNTPASQLAQVLKAKSEKGE